MFIDWVLSAHHEQYKNVIEMLTPDYVIVNNNWWFESQSKLCKWFTVNLESFLQNKLTLDSYIHTFALM